MKNFKQLIRELPSNKVVAAFGQFQPPTAGHEHLVKAVQSIANNGDHVIYASANEDKKLNPLPADRKVYFLQRMFAEGNFKSSEGITSIVEMASELSKKYKHLTVVTFADKVGEYEQQLKEHNGTMYQFDTIKVISAGDVDPDSNTVSVVSNVKMCESAKTGNFTQFKKGVPHTLTELDSRRLMNDLRKGMGLDPIRENVIFERTKIREQYVAGKIFNVGDRVKDEDGVYEIMDRGANYITVVNESGNLMKKWIDKVSPSRKKIEENLDTNPNEISFKNYTTTNFHKDPRVFHAFKGTISKWEQGGIEDGVAVLNAIKHTDSYLSMVDGKDRTSEADKAKQALARIGEYQSHDYWDDHKIITTADVISKHNADLQNAISKVNVKEESEVMDSKKIAMRYKEFMKKSGSKEKAVDIAEPSSGKPMTVFKDGDGKLIKQIPGNVGSQNTDVTEAYQKKTAYQKLNARMKTVTGKSLDDRSKEMDKIKQDTLDRIAQYKKEGIIKNEHIEKVGGGYEVESEHGNKNLGKYKSLAGAKKRLKQIEYFKHMKEEHDDQYEMATGFKAAAEHSLFKGNKGAYHAHMANHHDHMGQWHERKNRTSSADREYEKAEFHHAETMKHPYIAEDTIVETFSSVEHKGDHKHITHGADFGFKVGKEHYAKISNLEHGDRHVFKCMDNNEYGCWRNGDNLHFKRHSHDGGIQTNMSTIIPVPMWNNQDAMGQDKPVSEETILESAPFKDLKSAVHYASEKVKTHRDHEDGIEVYKHKAGGYDVNHTMNANGRNALHGSGAKHLGTVYRDKQFNIKHNIKEDLDEAHKLGDKVIMTKGPKDVVGKVGHVGEIRKRWTGDTNTYTIDHEGGSIQLKPTHFKKFKESSDQYVKEDIYSSDTRTKKVQVQDKDGNWVFKDRKSHPHKINFAASKMNGKPAQVEDPTKLDTETAYQNHLDKQAKARANEAWVLNPDGKTKKKYKDIKDNKTLSNTITTPPFDAFSNTNNQT
jgi:phosphopantetheine adenylyltransferase